MLGLGVALTNVAGRIRGGAVPPPAGVTTIVIEGDSITSTTPDQSANRGDFYSYAWADANPAKTSFVRARGSRTVGGGGDTGTPSGNTLLLQRDADLGYAPQLITAFIGANDLGTFPAATYVQRLIDWAGPIRAAGVRIAYAAPLPYSNAAANYANFTSRRNDLYDTIGVRDPAVWGQWADAYIPLGEHPDFKDAAQIDALITPADGIHPTGPVANGATGQARLFAGYAAAMRALTDPGRAASAQVFGDVWPASETNLAAATPIVRRFIVSGIAHAGLASGVSVTGGGAEVRLNGGAYGASVGTGSGNGHRIYNGDVIDLRLTTSAGSSTAVSIDLTIGTETRTLTYTTTANVTPASYVHGDVLGQAGAAAVHIYAARAFGAMGTGVVAVKASGAAPTRIEVSNAGANSWTEATQRFAPSVSAQGILAVYTVPVTAGSKDVRVTFPSYRGQSCLSWGVVTDADATPTQLDGAAPTSQSQPHQTGALTVPANGIALAFFGEYGGASITPATANGGTTAIDEGSYTYQSETHGIAVATRTTSGTASWNFAFGSHPRGAVVFKAAGT